MTIYIITIFWQSSKFGFRTKRSTSTALLDFTDTILQNLDDDFVSGVIFLDLRKAFDTVDLCILLEKMLEMEVSQKSCEWFKSYLDNRQQRTVYNLFSSDSAYVFLRDPCWVLWCFWYISTIYNCGMPSFLTSLLSRFVLRLRYRAHGNIANLYCLRCCCCYCHCCYCCCCCCRCCSPFLLWIILVVEFSLVISMRNFWG